MNKIKVNRLLQIRQITELWRPSVPSVGYTVYCSGMTQNQTKKESMNDHVYLEPNTMDIVLSLSIG